MPPFQGQLSEQNLLQLIAYIKSLSAKSGGSSVGAGGEAGGIGQGVRGSQGMGGAVYGGADRSQPTSQGTRGTRDNKTQDRGLTSQP
jgi:hypothetical protein